MARTTKSTLFGDSIHSFIYNSDIICQQIHKKEPYLCCKLKEKRPFTLRETKKRCKQNKETLGEKQRNGSWLMVHGYKQAVHER